MITTSILAVIIQSAILILALIAIYVKLITRITALEKENKNLNESFSEYKINFSKANTNIDAMSISIIKMENIYSDIKRNQDRVDELYKNKDIVVQLMNDVKIQLVEIKTEMKFKNGTKS